MQIEPIAYIKTDFKEKFGIPRQSGRSPSSVGKIVFTEKYSNKESVRGIDEFSYLWLIFGFSQTEYKSFSPTVRPPRLGGNKRVGVFASRSPFRPNSLGLSSVKLEKIEIYDWKIVLIVSGVDLLDGTPIYDIKPYLSQTDCHIGAKSGYSNENWEYKLNVNFSDNLLNIVSNEKKQALIECLADDPRPSYQEDNRIYYMRFADYDIAFKVEKNILTVIEIKEDVQ